MGDLFGAIRGDVQRRAKVRVRYVESDNDLDVRVVANASIGVLRAVIREALAGDGHRSVAEAVDAGLARIAPIFPPAR